MASLLAIVRLQKFIWVLIYGGLLTLVLGLSVQRTDGPMGLAMSIGGGFIAACGVALIYLRSRMKETE
jgi:hypothetical protein